MSSEGSIAVDVHDAGWFALLVWGVPKPKRKIGND